MTHLEDLQEGEIARIVYRSDKSGNKIEVAGEVEMHTTTEYAEGTAHNVRIKDEDNDRLVLAHTEPSDNRNGQVKSVTGNKTQKLGILREVSGAKVYRVWLNESDPAGGDRREAARYRAFTMKQVAEAVKEDQFDTLPEHLEEGGMGDRMTLQWHEDPPEEYQDEDSDMFQGTTYTFEIEEDNSATFPMQLITGGSAGRDLTGVN